MTGFLSVREENITVIWMSVDNDDGDHIKVF